MNVELVYELFKYTELSIICINDYFLDIGETEYILRKINWFNRDSGCNYCIACASKDNHLDIVIYFYEILKIPINIPSLYLSVMHGNIEIFEYLYSQSKNCFEDVIWSNCIEYSKDRINNSQLEQLRQIIGFF